MKHHKGFTLIELLLYVGVTSTLLLGITFFVSGLLESRVKNQTIAEVEQQGMQVMQMITQALRNAEAINSPATSTSATSISLDMVPSADDPTVFDLSGGEIRITEGVGTATALTNNRVIASALLFENLSHADAEGLIRVSFTLTHLNPESRFEFDASEHFSTSVSLRPQ